MNAYDLISVLTMGSTSGQNGMDLEIEMPIFLFDYFFALAVRQLDENMLRLPVD